MSVLNLFAEMDEKINGVLTELEVINDKLDRLLASGGEKTICEGSDTLGANNDLGVIDSKLPVVVEKTIIKGGTTVPKNDYALQMTGKYQWYRFADQEGKVRKCDNQGCNLFLKYNKDKKSYEHWKYDVNTGKGGYVQDKCEHYFPEGEN